MAGLKLHSMSLRARLILLVTILSLPYPLIIFLLVNQQNRAIDFGAKEADGTLYLRPVFDHLVKSAEAYANGAQVPSFTPALESAIESYDKQMLTGNNVQTVRQTQNPEAAVKRTLEWNYRIGDQSNLILDPDLDSYYLMDVILLRLPRIVDVVTELTASARANDQAAIRMHVAVLEDLLSEMDRAFEASYQQNETVRQKLKKPEKDFIQASQRFMNTAQNGGEAETVRAGTAYMKALRSLYTPVSSELERLLNARVNRFRTEQYLTLGVVGILLCISVVILFLVLRSIVKPLRNIDAMMKDISEGDGDLTVRLDESDKSEIGSVAHYFNLFTVRLADVVSQVIRTGEDLKGSIDTERQSISQLADEAQNEAASMEEMAATMEQISSSAEQVDNSVSDQVKTFHGLVESMHTLNEEIRTIKKELESGISSASVLKEKTNTARRELNRTGDTMNKLHESSVEMGAIVAMIQEIAERTNLLSLNASIEAARAGEAGRGFAVVAQEVSKLADQTNSSIQNISNLIEENDQRITSGVNDISSAISEFSSLLTEIESIIRSMNTISERLPQQDKVKEDVQYLVQDLDQKSEVIRSVTREQRDAIQEASKTVNRLTNTSQTYADAARQIEFIAAENEKSAQKLHSLVSFFRV